jgi:hypothetical protein
MAFDERHVLERLCALRERIHPEAAEDVRVRAALQRFADDLDASIRELRERLKVTV